MGLLNRWLSWADGNPVANAQGFVPFDSTDNAYGPGRMQLATVAPTAPGGRRPGEEQAANQNAERAAQPSTAFGAPAGFMTPQQTPQQPTAPQATPTPAAARGGLLSRFQQALGGDAASGRPAITDTPLWQISAALLANADRGGNWGDALTQFGQSQQGTAERRRVATQDARESEQWTWAQQERANTTERRRMAQDYIDSRPEAERAELRMVDPDELGSYLQQQRQYGLQQQQLELQTEEARDNRAYRGASLSLDRQRLAQDRVLNSSQALLGRGEAERMNADMGRLSNWNLVDNDISALEEILQRNPAAFDQITDGDESVVLARVRDPQMRRDLNTIYAISTNLAREELRGQTPVSNIDLLSAIRGNPNSQAGHLFVRDWLGRARQDREDLQGAVQSRLQYMQGGGGRSLYEPDPTTGRNWYQSQDGYTRYGANGATPPPSAAPGASSGEQQEAARALAARRERGSAAPSQFGNVGGRPTAPRLLREPNDYEATIIRQYQEATRTNQQERMRTLEARMRQRGLIP